MKIIIVGASVGGLLSAYNLGQDGHEVVVYEKKAYQKIGYDWYDFVSHNFFTDLNISTEVDWFIKSNMSFEIFNYSDIIRLNQKETEREYGIHRFQLLEFLYQKAQNYAQIHFNEKVDSLIIENNKVTGVMINHQKIMADLVIDNSGVNSCLRQQLPDSFNIEKEIAANSLMYTYRAIYDQDQQTDLPKDDAKCYLRHLGDNGISWVNLEKDNKVDVLIGRIGGLEKGTIDEALQNLRKENPIIGKKIISGGKTYIIPVRYPQTKIFADGYLLIGDSGFMTVPLLGSGIHSSVKAANILREILPKDRCSEEDLYCYQKKLYQTFLCDFYEIDVIKNFLLQSNIEKLLILLKIGVINQNDITNIYNAKPFCYSFSTLFKKGVKGIFHPLLLLQMLTLLRRTKKIKKIVQKMPKDYNYQNLRKWQEKIQKFFHNSPS